ncbi:MAG: ABC transporter ATP-binding protein [Deltaproteobacteria bacterium]|nr:ABC transporter ATP-binding protein [Deltaproteobacteria bacterium]
MPDTLEKERQYLLDVRGVSVFYETIQAIWEISFTVAEGSVTALVGSNGAGKTAIMKSIAGILPLSQGSIFFGDQPLERLAPHERVERGISLVPEGRKIFPYLTVLENLEIGAYNRKARKRLSQTLDEIFRLFPPLAARRNQLGVSLSGGEQQMLAIGRGLMSVPRLLMLDEPSLGLAPIVVKLVFEIVKKINEEGVTILLVEQNVRQTLQHAQTAYVLETGRITLQGMGSELLDDPYIKKAYLGL